MRPLQVDPEWSAQAPRPFDPYLTEYGEQQVRWLHVLMFCS